jgi:hypothetical protein
MHLRFAAPLCLLGLSSLLTGCTLQTTAPAADITSASITGTVHGGSQPIYGARVYLLTPNPTGYAGPGLPTSRNNASISLLGPTSHNFVPDTIGYYATTDSTTGGFSLAGNYSCTNGYLQSNGSPSVTLSGSEQVYLYVLGGQAANIASANRSSGLLVALGPCNSPTLQVTVNELTTAATAYAFAGFATDATHIGSSGSALALQGLTNAFANVANLAAVSNGSAAVSATNITRPVANINTIANILSACVDGLTANANCGTLFKYTESSGATGTAPTDTATAATNLAHNPYPTSAGMTALWGLAPGAGSPYAPGLTSQPNDFTLGLTLAGNGLNGDQFLAIDAAGNAWVTNSYSLSEFTSTGAAATGSPYTGGGLSQYTEGLAIDSSGNLWIPNALASNVSVFSSAGTPLPNTPYSGGGLRQPQCVAIDASGNAWFANTLGTSISALASNGTPLSGSPFPGSNYAECLGISPANQIWVSNTYNTLSVFTNAGSTVAGSPFSGGGLNGPFGIAFDLSGNAWSGNIYGNNLSVFTNAGVPLTGSPFGGAGISYPVFPAIDSVGNVWIADQTAHRISELSSSGAAITPASGYTGGITGNTNYPAIDGSGNVWVTQSNATVTELIGAAAPVVTPVVANLLAPYGTSAVNRP